MIHTRHVIACGAIFCLAWAWSPAAAQTPNALAQEPKLTEEQMKHFLLTAEVINSKHTGKGITSPWHLTLSDGTLTHDAAFQTVDESKNVMQFPDGRTEINFRDSYHYDIAAYELAKLLGLEGMMPVTVERKWRGDRGALSWWIPWKWDEQMRLAQKIEPPDADAWNNQMFRKRVFAELVYDSDPNLTNLLITEDWKIWMIDFTRAFRLYKTLRNPKNLEKCDRQLLDKMRKLDYDGISAQVGNHLRKGEIQALLARRDKMVAYIEQLVAEKGEGAVLY